MTLKALIERSEQLDAGLISHAEFRMQAVRQILNMNQADLEALAAILARYNELPDPERNDDH